MIFSLDLLIVIFVSNAPLVGPRLTEAQLTARTM